MTAIMDGVDRNSICDKIIILRSISGVGRGPLYILVATYAAIIARYW